MTTISKVRFKIWTDDGSFIEADALGEGADTGDKSCNKSAAQAAKYLFMQVFCIRVKGEDNDAENDSPEYKSPAKQPSPSPAKKEYALDPAKKMDPKTLTPAQKKAWLLGQVNKFPESATTVFRAANLITDEQVFGDIDEKIVAGMNKTQGAALVADVYKDADAGHEMPADTKVPRDPDAGQQEPDDDVPDGALEVTAIVEYVSEKTGKKKDGTPWTSYGVKTKDGTWYNTFSNRLGNEAKSLKGETCVLTYSEEERGNKLHKIEIGF